MYVSMYSHFLLFPFASCLFVTHQIMLVQGIYRQLKVFVSYNKSQPNEHMKWLCCCDVNEYHTWTEQAKKPIHSHCQSIISIMALTLRLFQGHINGPIIQSEILHSYWIKIENSKKNTVINVTIIPTNWTELNIKTCWNPSTTDYIKVKWDKEIIRNKNWYIYVAQN